MMSLVCDEKEWTSYVNVVMKSEIRGIDLVARMVAHNDVGDESSRSLTLPKAVDEQHVECGVLLTQLLQETQAGTIEEPPFIGSNEIVEPICGRLGVGDVVPNASFVSGVDP
jgi:hypothetical protein